jgi:hypothetical protein
VGRLRKADALVQQLVKLFAELPQVEAIALGGSRASGRADDASDFDVYICIRSVIPVETRRDIVRQLGGASVANLGLDYFGAGDEWVDAAGTHFDLMYFGLEWLKSQVERPLVQHQPSLGYSTAFAYTVSRARIMHDPHGKFAALQALTLGSYPAALREAVVRYNYPILRETISSYAAQLEKAAARYDLVSLNHRLVALLASYFDIVFAVNRSLHPGEKRLVEAALTLPSLPENFERDVTETLTAAGDAARLLPKRAGRLADS